MAYSDSRLRNTLALVRVITGAVFFALGMFKISSLEFGKFVFPAFLDNAARGGAVEWLRPMMNSIQAIGPARIGVTLGFVELTIGIALVLGLAVRPACLMGILYSGWLLLATWNPLEGSASMLQTTEHQFRNLFPLMTFLLLGVGHAGETWGLGARYHRSRARSLADASVPKVHLVFKKEESVFYQEPDEMEEESEEIAHAEQQGVGHRS